MTGFDDLIAFGKRYGSEKAKTGRYSKVDLNEDEAEVPSQGRWAEKFIFRD